MSNKAESIEITRSKKDGYKYFMRITYKTRLVVLNVKDEAELSTNVQKYLYDGVDEEGGNV